MKKVFLFLLVLCLIFPAIAGAQCLTLNDDGTVKIQKSCIQYMGMNPSPGGTPSYLFVRGKCEGPGSDWAAWNKIHLRERVKNQDAPFLMQSTDTHIILGAPKLGLTMSRSWLGQWYFKATLGMSITMWKLTDEQVYNIKALINP